MAAAEPQTPLTQRRDVYFVAVAISPLVRELGLISCATVGEPDWRRANTRSLDASLDSRPHPAFAAGIAVAGSEI